MTTRTALKHGLAVTLAVLLILLFVATDSGRISLRGFHCWRVGNVGGCLWIH